MTRIILALLIAATTLLAPSTAEARSTYPTFDYKLCMKYGTLFGAGKVCLRALVTRQANSMGFNFHNVRVYGSSPGTPDNNCTLFEPNPAIRVDNVSIRASANGDGSPGTVKWNVDDPDLGTGNECWNKYEFPLQPGGVVTANNRYAEVKFNYKARMENGNDHTDEVWVRFWIDPQTSNLEWGCQELGFEDPDECSRS